MGKNSRSRASKPCGLCDGVSPVLYRISTSKEQHWYFVCEPCLKLAKEHMHYQYGGTWKQNKRN